MIEVVDKIKFIFFINILILIRHNEYILFYFIDSLFIILTKLNIFIIIF
jgi:hypothetical protein